MLWSHGSRAVVRQQWRLCRGLGPRAAGATLSPLRPLRPLSPPLARTFHGTRSLLVVKPVLLADIGEGMARPPTLESACS